MNIYNDRRFCFRFTKFLIILVSLMFLITIYLSFKLLTSEHCNYPRQEYIVKHNVIATAKAETYGSAHKLAVLVPFRDRFDELLQFVPYMNKFLKEQKINHHIFILNQVDSYRFNRASLINVGYIHTKNEYDYIAMHDVDLLPLNKNLRYEYPVERPFHVAAPNLHPRYHYDKFVGGILLINREQFNLVNGMSNKYWGWGLEDDEFYVRLRDAHLNVSRPINITTNTTNTFRHIHDRNHRKRDTVKCYNQREVTRKRDRQTGLHNVNFKIVGINSMAIDGISFTVINIQLICNHSLTPWCDCSEKNNKAKKDNAAN